MHIKVAFEDLAEQRYKRIKSVTFWALITVILATTIVCINSCTNPIPANAQTLSATLKASWYSIESLKKEGTFKYSKGVCADGSLFKDDNLTAASRDYPLGAILRITNLQNGKSVTIKVTDRIGKRFKGKRIDLSRRAFIALVGSEQGLNKGLLPVKIEVIK